MTPPDYHHVTIDFLPYLVPEETGNTETKERETAFWDVNKIYRAFWYGTDEEPPIWVYWLGFGAMFTVIWFFAWPSNAFQTVVYLVGLFPLLGLIGYVWRYLHCHLVFSHSERSFPRSS